MNLDNMSRRELFALEYAITGCFLSWKLEDVLVTPLVAIKIVRKLSTNRAALTAVKQVCNTEDKKLGAERLEKS